QDPLLRIHLTRLARRDAKKSRFEAVDVADQACRPSVALTCLAGSRVIEEPGRPPRSVDFGDRIGAGSKQLPVRLEPGSAGESARRAEDRDGPVTHSAEANSIPWSRKQVTAGGAPSFIIHPTPQRLVLTLFRAKAPLSSSPATE